MSAINSSLLALAFAAVVLVGAYGGTLARRWVPASHQDVDTRDVVKLGAGFLGTLAALVLGLVVASAKASFDLKTIEVQTVAAKALQLDRSLKRLGAEALPARQALRELVASRIGRLGERPGGADITRAGLAAAQPLVVIHGMLHDIQPADERQREAVDAAIKLAEDVLRTMSDLVSQAGSSITAPLLVLLMIWFAVIMAGWNFVAPTNATTWFVNVICALSISGAIFMLLEMDQPFGGVIQISDSPLQAVLPHMGA